MANRPIPLDTPRNPVWAWCRAGRHQDCRVLQQGSDGVYDRCGCSCHVLDPDHYDR